MTAADVARVRAATVGDAEVIARHRAEMFRDMGALPDALYEPLRAAARAYVERAIATGEYVGWLAAPIDRPGEVIAGAGVQLRPILPRPVAGRVALGPEAIVLNVFTERPWRLRGLAALLMRHVLDWARINGIASLVLHAAPDGRALYERLGFVGTNEMRFPEPGTGRVPADGTRMGSG